MRISTKWDDEAELDLENGDEDVKDEEYDEEGIEEITGQKEAKPE